MANLALYKKSYNLLLEDMALSTYRKNLISFSKAGSIKNKIDPGELAQITNLSEFLAELNDLIKEIESYDEIKALIGPVENFITTDRKYKIVSLKNKIYNAISTVKIVKAHRINQNKIIEQSKKEYGHRLIDDKIDVYIPFTYEANRFLSHSVLTKPGQPIPSWCIAASDHGPTAWAQYKLERDVVPNVFIFARRKSDGSGWEDQKYEVVFPNGTAPGIYRKNYPATAVRSAEWRHPEQTEGKNYWHFTNNFRKVFPELTEDRLNSLFPELMAEFLTDKSEIEKRHSKIIANINSVEDCIDVMLRYNFQPAIPDERLVQFDDFNIKSALNYIKAGSDISAKIISQFLNLPKLDTKGEISLLIQTVEKLYNRNYDFSTDLLNEIDEEGLKNLAIIDKDSLKKIFQNATSIGRILLYGNYLVELGIFTENYLSELIYKKIFQQDQKVSGEVWFDDILYKSIILAKKKVANNSGTKFYSNFLAKIYKGLSLNENAVQDKIYQIIKKDGWLLPVLLNLVKRLPNAFNVQARMFNLLYRCGLAVEIKDCLPLVSLTDGQEIITEYFKRIITARPEILKERKLIKDAVKWYSEEGDKELAAWINSLSTRYSTQSNDSIAGEEEKVKQIINKISDGECTNDLIKELFLADLDAKNLLPYLIEAMDELNDYIPVDSKHKIDPEYFFFYLTQMSNQSEILQDYTSSVGHFIGQHYRDLIDFIRYREISDEWVKAIIDVTFHQLYKEKNINVDIFEKLKAICINIKYYLSPTIRRYFLYQLNLYKPLKMKLLPFLPEN